MTPELLSQYSLVVIAGSYSPYASSEVAAYADFVSRDDARLLILPSGSQGGSALSDIAALLELDLARSAGRTSPVVGHPLTDGLGHWYFSGLAISPSSSADLVPLVLMDDGHLAMAEITSEPAEIVFYGDITPVWMMIEPLYANLVTWLLR